MSILDKPISYYPSIHDTNSGSVVSLLKILESGNHENLIQALRIETDPSNQKRLKESLPCFTVAGIFKGRSKDGLISMSGLAAVDLDSAEDYDPLKVLKELQKLPYIAYGGLSCRGNRLYAIIPFLYPEQYERHYSRLIRSFEDIGFPMGDACHKSISQPRFVSYNTENTQFFNHEAKKYHLLEAERIFSFPNPLMRVNKTELPEDRFQWCANQINKSNTFKENNRHSYIFKLARYCNLKGIDETETLKGCFQFIQPNFNETEVALMVKYVYEKHKNSFNKYPFR